MMPITVIKVRYESSLYTYRSLWGAGTAILRTEGPKGFFTGFGATAARDAPYAGLYVLFYESLKKRLSALAWSGMTPGRTEMTTATAAPINFMSGVLAAGLATTLTNPFDAVKTRLQLMPGRYGNMVYAVKTMLREEGIRSLFDGLALRVGRKAASSALAWTLYEELIRSSGRRWEEGAKVV
jgi:solute carrier family 25 protein 38